MYNEERLWFVSDLHFYHKNILNFSPETRPFSDVDEMNNALITSWNDKVSLTDEVWMLGDFCFGSPTKACRILEQLNGRINIIKGNHDNIKFLKRATEEGLIESWRDYRRMKVNGTNVILFHYPIYSWDMMFHGGYHLFGHVHGNMDGMIRDDGKAWLDVGIDSTLISKEPRPYSFAEIREHFQNKVR